MSTTLKKSRARQKTGALPATGLVNWQIKGVLSKSTPATPSKLIEAIDAGLPFSELEALRLSLDLPMDKLAPRLGISVATIQRRKEQGRLDPSESDRVLRFARLVGQAVTVFGSEDDARRWLNAPQFGLGGIVPLDYARTEVGAREVENLLGRIEYGVYS